MSEVPCRHDVSRETSWRFLIKEPLSPAPDFKGNGNTLRSSRLDTSALFA
ncbi:hypothetical protein [Zymobacter sp. IVIA_5232.4 C2]